MVQGATKFEIPKKKIANGFANNVTLGMSKGAQYLSYKSSNIQMRKPVFWSTFEWPPQPCIQKLAPCNFASHLVVGTADITIK